MKIVTQVILPSLSSKGEAPVQDVSMAVRALLQGPLRLADAVLTFASMLAAAGAIWSVAYLAQLGILDREALTLSLSIACPLITIVAFVAPAPMVIEAVKRMNASNLPTQVFQSQAACNMLSIAYGLQISNAAVLITNMFGLAAQILFLSGEHYIRASNSQWVWFAMKLSLLINTGIFFFARVAPINVLGQLITVFNVILYSSPLARLGSVLRSRNSAAFSATLTAVGVANNAFWTLYALLIEDIVVLLPSVLGYALSFFQVLVIFWCRGYLPFDLSFLLLFFKKEPERNAEDDEEWHGKGAGIEEDDEEALSFRSPKVAVEDSKEFRL
eukprot:TRINITY_DN79308_c0_g1_i1.p1 TRINITY_DN79308_c0_g1~~TRINITY_DN79308_c0_g1_i1.p1  ORF type:complete len:329 (+),score=69.20 TRINITY_DN79308_c0_g1_i1:81-1067(+)